MNFANNILFILSFINFLFIGLGGLHSVSEKSEEISIISTNSSHLFNNDQVYKVDTDYSTTGVVLFSELFEEDEEHSQNKILFNPLLTLDLVKNLLIKPKTDLPQNIISTKVDKYLILQTFRL
jgi:hypothetical protein